MAEDIIQAIAKVRAPVAKNVIQSSASPDYNAGEIVLDVTTTAIRVEIPSWLKGRYVEITPHGASVGILCGGSAVTATYAQATGVASEVMTVHAESCRRYVDGTTRGFVMPNDSRITHMAIDASGTGILSIGLASDAVIEQARG